MNRRKSTPLSKRDMPAWVRANPEAYNVDWDSLPEEREAAVYSDAEVEDAIRRSLKYLKDQSRNYDVITIDEISPGFFQIYENELGMILGTFSIKDAKKYLESFVKYGDGFDSPDVLVNFIFTKAPVIESWLNI